MSMTHGYTKQQNCGTDEIGIQLTLSLTRHPVIVHNAAVGLKPLYLTIPCQDGFPHLLIKNRERLC